jgi:hypothetical protein
MSITAVNASDTATGNGATTVFPFTFCCRDEAAVQVYIDDVQLTAGFQVVFNSTSGGSVTFVTAPAIGAKVEIVSNPSFQMLTKFADAGSFLPSVMDDVNEASALRDIKLLDMVSRLQAPSPTDFVALIARNLIAGANISVSVGTDGKITISSPVALYTDEKAQDAVAAALVAGTGIGIAYDDVGGTITITNTVSYTDEQVRDVVGATLVAGANVSITVNDGANTITIDAAGGSGSTDPEVVRDTMAVALVAGAGVTIVVDDAANTITITSSITQYTDEMARDALGTAITAGAGITKTVDDAGDTITIASSITQYTDEMARDAIGTALVATGGITATINDALDSITLDTSTLGPKFMGMPTASANTTLSDATHNNTVFKLTGSTTRVVTADASTTTGFSTVLWNLGTVNMTLSCPAGVYKNGAATTATSATLAPGAVVTLIHVGGGVYIASGPGLT